MDDFGRALEKLGIPEYREKIFSAHSHGELMHLIDYIDIADQIDDVKVAEYRGTSYEGSSWFKIWFKDMGEQYGNRFYCNVLEVLNQCIKKGK